VAEGWLPPQAPGGQPPPHFDMVVPDAAPARPAPAHPSQPDPEPAPALPPARRSGLAAPPRTNGLALTALILGILGLAVLALTLGLGFIVAVPCSAAAWMCGANARARIELGEATSGRGQAMAGYLLGIAGVVIGVAAAAGWIIWIANGGDLDQLQRDLERWRETHTQTGLFQALSLYLSR
jgi:uncharacterized iron-regulated membrane protein